jgi:large subunit ribosomal protein L22
MKRIRPAPMGRAYRYQRRLAHIVISVAERKQEGLVQKVTDGTEAAPVAKSAKKKTAVKKAPAKKAAAKKPAAKKTPAKKAAK